MNAATPLVSVIIGLPLAGFFFNGLLGLAFKNYRPRKRLIGFIANLCILFPFGAAVYFFVALYSGSAPATAVFYNWIVAGSFHVNIAFQIDQLSVFMALVVTGVSFLIHLYSVGYMWDDDDFWLYFAFLNLFVFNMLVLVLANNLLLLFLGWEGVGLCSYLLIGFWFDDMANVRAANKAFIYNRVGDFAFLLALFMTFHYVGSLNYHDILSNLQAIPPHAKFWIGFTLLIGATGKSAQIPLFVWLPDAMAGPTPVSALIHAATMVTSGVYLISRLSPMFMMSPTLMVIIALGGALTAIVAATIAITRNDIKKVLAYSTVSQIGYMFLALGAGAFSVAMFHLMAHAFFKALLFMGAGSVIHSMEHIEESLQEEGKTAHIETQDMRFMGGLKKYMPSTYKTFVIASLAISGIPFFVGFFSKDEILSSAYNAGLGNYASGLYYLVWVIGIITAFLTAFYMFRLVYGTFHGPFKLPSRVKEAIGAEKYLHESPKVMIIPMWILGGLSVVGGLLGLPSFWVSAFSSAEAHINLIDNWLQGVTATVATVMPLWLEGLLMFVSVFLAVAGIGVAYAMYRSGDTETADSALMARLGWLYRLWNKKYSLDEIYEGGVMKPALWFSDKGLGLFDKKVVDGIVNTTSGATRLFGSVFRYIQTGVASTYAVFYVIGIIIVLCLLLF
jgi:NADH-quinone oxidoreductase subunit L